MVGKRSALVDAFARRYMPLLRSASETRFVPHIILDFHKDLHYRYNFKHLNIPGFRCSASQIVYHQMIAKTCASAKSSPR